MAVLIKNIILYDPYQHVSGFVELRTDSRYESVHSDGGAIKTGGTAVKLRHNLSVDDLLLSVFAGGESHVLNIHEQNQTLHIPETVDFSKEIVVCVMKKEGSKVSTLASGAINLSEKSELRCADSSVSLPEPSVSPLSIVLDDTGHLPISRKLADGNSKKYQTDAAREIDELLRAVCTVDENGKGICETCPYREHFFGENIDLTSG